MIFTEADGRTRYRSLGTVRRNHRGAKYGTHGESPVVSWNCEIEKEEGSIASAKLSVRGVRYPFQLDKQVEINKDEAKLSIRETLTNYASQDLEFFWLQHPSFGEPFLAPGDQISLPPGTEIENIVEINPNGRIDGGKFSWPQGNGKKIRGE